MYYQNCGCMPTQNYPAFQPKPVDNNCKSDFLQDLNLASSYVPIQSYEGVLPLNEAFKRGSAFPNLFVPYHKGGMHQ